MAFGLVDPSDIFNLVDLSDLLNLFLAIYSVLEVHIIKFRQNVRNI